MLGFVCHATDVMCYVSICCPKYVAYPDVVDLQFLRYNNANVVLIVPKFVHFCSSRVYCSCSYWVTPKFLQLHAFLHAVVPLACLFPSLFADNVKLKHMGDFYL